jgi:hypothetical protein
MAWAPKRGWRSGRLWIALVAAALAVLAWSGNLRMLDPTDVTWINQDDPLVHVMGWEQFRASPLLQYPITRNEGYGLERGSSLVYSDSIPIAALVLRPLGPILPHPFQYLGWWTVLSLVLQGYWAARLIALRADRAGPVVLGAAFFLVAPTLLNRIGIHTALTSQWMITCALWLYFSSREPRARRWAVLLGIAAGVHAYLLVMVGGIWAAHLVKCRLARALGYRDLVHAAATLVAVAAWMHALGYFVIKRHIAVGGGSTKFDLVNFVADLIWNSLLPIPYRNQEPNAWDGLAYLGAGMLGLLVASVGVAAVRRIRRARSAAGVPPAPPGAEPAGRGGVRWLPLVVVAAAFLVFAASHRVQLDGQPILTYRWPRTLLIATAMFRGAGRMIWPTYHVVMLAILWLAIRTMRRATLVLGIAVVVQLIDLRGGARVMRASVAPPGILQPLRDPIWNTIQARYRRMVSVPAWHGQPDRVALGWFCAVHGIASNIGNFSAGMDLEGARRGARQRLDEVLRGAYDPHTVYSFPSAALWNLARLAASPRDLAIVADGHHLLIPGGDPGGTVRPADDVIGPPLDTWLSFAADGPAAGFLLDGWSWRESWGTWSDGTRASLIAPVPRGYRGKLRIGIRWLGHLRPGRRHVAIRFDQAEFPIEFDHDMENKESYFDIDVTRDWVLIDLTIEGPIIAPDSRALGIGLVAIRETVP